MERIIAFFLVFFLSGLMSCVAPPQTQPMLVQVQVDAYAAKNQTFEGMSYRLYSGFPDSVEESRSQVETFIHEELTTYVENALAEAGFQEAAQESEADLAIFFTYGVSEPKTFEWQAVIPIYRQSGVSSKTTTGESRTYQNHYRSTTQFSSQTYYTPRYEVTGSRSISKSETYYIRHLNVSGYYMADVQTDSAPPLQWTTTATSTGSSEELRKIFPYIAYSTIVYLGKSSKESRRMEFEVGDRKIQRFSQF